MQSFTFCMSRNRSSMKFFVNLLRQNILPFVSSFYIHTCANWTPRPSSIIINEIVDDGDSENMHGNKQVLRLTRQIQLTAINKIEYSHAIIFRMWPNANMYRKRKSEIQTKHAWLLLKRATENHNNVRKAIEAEVLCAEPDRDLNVTWTAFASFA